MKNRVQRPCDTLEAIERIERYAGIDREAFENDELRWHPASRAFYGSPEQRYNRREWEAIL